MDISVRKSVMKRASVQAVMMIMERKYSVVERDAINQEKHASIGALMCVIQENHALMKRHLHVKLRSDSTASVDSGSFILCVSLRLIETPSSATLSAGNIKERSSLLWPLVLVELKLWTHQVLTPSNSNTILRRY